MGSRSRPVSPFIPPRPGQAPAPVVVPPAPPGASPADGIRVIPPNPYAVPRAQPEPLGWGPGPNPYAHHPAQVQAHRTPHRTDGLPMPGYDPGTYFSRPPYASTPAANPPPTTTSYDEWGLPRDFGRPPSIRNDRDGFAEDYRGPRTPLDDWSTLARQVPVPSTFADQVPPGTPWYPMLQSAPMNTGYSTFQQPLPGAAPAPYPAATPYSAAAPFHATPPYGAPPMGFRRPSHSRSRSAHNTPWMGGGYMPVTPGGNSQPLPGPGGPAPDRPDRMAGGVDTRWMVGIDYGPVLDPLIASIVKCQPKVNPLLSPPPDDPSQRDFLTWNMLFPSSFVHHSKDREDQSWITGRDSPATFPRVKTMRIISRQFTWFIDVKGRDHEVGVTCGDVIDTLAKFFYGKTQQAEYEACSSTEQVRISTAYHNNRARSRDVPGGTLGHGLRRCDFLGERTMFGGIIVDRDYIRERLQIGRSQRDFPCIFILICEGRMAMTQEELRAERSRSRSRRHARVETDSESDSE